MGSGEKKELPPGILVTMDLSSKEIQLLCEYMETVKKNSDADIIFNLFGAKALEFYDVFAGRTLKMPAREEMYKLVTYVKIYAYVRSHGNNEEALRQASYEFHRKVSSIKRICDKVDLLLTSDLKEVLYGKG